MSPRRRKPASARSPSPSTGRATASCRRSSASCRCCQSIGGKAPTSPARKRDVTADHARAAARLRAVSPQGFRAGPHARLRKASTTTGARISTSSSAPTISTDPLRIFPRLHGRARGLQGRSGRLAHREQRQELGDRLRFSGRARQAGGAGGISDPQFRRHAGLRLQYPARQVQGSARAPRLQLRVRFRGNEQADLLRPVQAHRQLFRGHRARVVRLAGGQGAGNSRNRAGQGAGRTVHQALHQPGRRQSAGGARQSARGARAACARPATRSSDTKLVDAKTGEPFSVEFLVDDPATERFVLFYKPSLERSA